MESLNQTIVQSIAGLAAWIDIAAPARRPAKNRWPIAIRQANLNRSRRLPLGSKMVQAINQAKGGVSAQGVMSAESTPYSLKSWHLGNIGKDRAKATIRAIR